MQPELIRLVERPSTERFMCSDGQVVDVRGHDSMERRMAALAYFEERTELEKPAKKDGMIWVRIEGAAILKRGGVRSDTAS